MNLCGLGRDRHFGIDAHLLRLFIAIGIYLEIGNFDNAVGHYVETCGLEIEEYNWFLEI
jgi:hypothetical protein